MKVNKIGFRLSTETFGPNTEPTDVVEIYIDDNILDDFIPCMCPLWPSELYESLMRNFFLEDEPVNICVCGCGCVGCGDTEVHIEETERFVIWYDFINDRKRLDSELLFIFEKKQYYTEVDKILNWIEDGRLAYYIGNVFTVWSDDLRFNYLADNLHSLCVMKSDFNSRIYSGREEVLNILKHNLLDGSYEQKESKNYFYRMYDRFWGMNNGEREIQERGYNKWYFELCHYGNPNAVVMYILFKTDEDGKIKEILLSRNKDWFHPVYWSPRPPERINP